MKKIIIGAVLLISGCTIAPREDKTCVDYKTIPAVKEECVGGRGVAPLICVQKPVKKLICVKYEANYE